MKNENGIWPGRERQLANFKSYIILFSHSPQKKKKHAETDCWWFILNRDYIMIMYGYVIVGGLLARWRFLNVEISVETNAKFDVLAFILGCRDRLFTFSIANISI